MRERFTAAAKALNLDENRVKFEFHKRMHVMRPEEGPAEMVEFFIKYFGPTKVAFSKLDAAGQDALRKDLVALWTKHNREDSGSGKLLVHAEYLEAIVRKG